MIEDGGSRIAAADVAILNPLFAILAQKNGGVRRVTLPLGTACKAGASLFSHGPGEKM